MSQRFQRILAAAFAACAFQAHAATITYDVVIDWTGGQLSGSRSAGYFSFDAGLAVPNASYTQADRLTAFSLELRGQTYSLADVGTGWLGFDGTGALSGFGIGTDCKPGVCYAYTGNPGSFYISYNAPSMLMGSVGDPQSLTSWGPGTLTLASSVPEPMSWALTLVGGFALIGRAMRHKAAQACSTFD